MSYLTFTTFSLLAGALYAMGFPIMGTKISFISGPIFAFTGLFLILENLKTYKQVLLTVTCFALGFYGLGFYWVPHTLTEFGGILSPYNSIIGAFSIFVLCPHIYLFGLTSFFLKKKNLPHPTHFLNVILTIVFMLYQYLTPQLFSAYPGHSWIKIAPNLGLAPFFGEYAYSFFSILIAFELKHLAIHKKFQQSHGLNWGIIFTFIILNYLIPTSSVEKTKMISVRIAQANVGNNAKLRAESGHENSAQKVIETYQKLSQKSSNKQLDLIIWPETAYPFSFTSGVTNTSVHKMPKIIKEVVNETKSDIVFGGYLRDDHSQISNVFNSAFFTGPNLETVVYNKNKLLPFGESLPFTDSINHFIHSLIPSISFFSRSNETQLMSSMRKGKKEYHFLTSICYEALSSSLIRKHLNSVKSHPSFLVNLTNDSWYGNTSEPEQHLFLSKWRAVEFQMPLIRSANTGISSIISKQGLELKRTKLNEVTNLDMELPINLFNKITFYQRMGALPVSLLVSIILFLNFIILTISRRRNLLSANHEFE